MGWENVQYNILRKDKRRFVFDTTNLKTFILKPLIAEKTTNGSGVYAHFKTLLPIKGNISEPLIARKVNII